MNNVFKDFNVGIRFDLKGSGHGRTLLLNDQKPDDVGRDKKTALKDNDFNKHFGYLELNDDSKETRSTSKSKRNKSRKSTDDTEYNIRNATAIK